MPVIPIMFYANLLRRCQGNYKSILHLVANYEEFQATWFVDSTLIWIILLLLVTNYYNL